MPRLIPHVIALLAFAAALSTAGAAEAPGRLEPLQGALSARRAELGQPTERTQRRAALGIDRALRVLANPKSGNSRKHEIQAAGKAARQVERRARDEGDLLSTVDALADGYTTLLAVEVEALQDILAADADAGTIRRKVLKRTRRATKKLQRSRSEPRRARRLQLLAKVDAALAILPSLGYDPGGGDPGGGSDPGRALAWVVNSLAISASGVGFDMDGDGTIDNALAGAQALVGPLNGGAPIDGFIRQNILNGSRLTVLQMWAVHDLQNDSDVSLGLLEPVDDDADPNDNLGGQETFTAVNGTLDSDGHANAAAATALTSGAYVTTLPRGLTNPIITTGLTIDTAIRIRGVVSEGANDGTLAVVFPLTDVQLLVNAMLPPHQQHLAAGIVATLLDVDTTGNGIPDSMSAAFDFTSVPCTIR